jgi:hypothetical protein
MGNSGQKFENEDEEEDDSRGRRDQHRQSKPTEFRAG